MSCGGELLAQYGGLLKSHHEYVQSTDSQLKSLQERCTAYQGLEPQVAGLKKQVFDLNDKVSSSDAAFVKAKAKGKERKKKIKSLSMNLDQLTIEVVRLSSDLNHSRNLSGSTVTLVASSSELPLNDAPPSSVASLEKNEEWINTMVDTVDEEMGHAAFEKLVELLSPLGRKKMVPPIHQVILLLLRLMFKMLLMPLPRLSFPDATFFDMFLDFSSIEGLILTLADTSWFRSSSRMDVSPISAPAFGFRALGRSIKVQADYKRALGVRASSASSLIQRFLRCPYPVLVALALLPRKTFSLFALPLPSFEYMRYALGWHLEEIHMTWAHLEKKETRLQLYTKVEEEKGT
ncbi:hypothetical protein Tco_0210396 [Tanacetum coccineum]